jgi:hypothetical protein
VLRALMRVSAGAQALLEHPFLHPNRAQQQQLGPPAAAALPVLSEQHMKLLVAQVQAAGAAGVTDLDALTRELMHKLTAASAATHGRSSSGAQAAAASGGNRQPQHHGGMQRHTAA